MQIKNILEIKNTKERKYLIELNCGKKYTVSAPKEINGYKALHIG